MRFPFVDCLIQSADFYPIKPRNLRAREHILATDIQYLAFDVSYGNRIS